MTGAEEKDREGIEEVVEEAPSEPVPEASSRSVDGGRESKRRLGIRERAVREAQDEVTAAFDAHAGLRKSVQEALRAVEAALGQCANLDRRCSGRNGRRLALARRLLLRPSAAALSASRGMLRRASLQLEAAARQRDLVLEEAADSGLDH